jgi:hypothetical protein
MLEECYKKIAKDLGINEYKVLADIYRLFYFDENKTRKMYEDKKIDKKTYDYIMNDFPTVCDWTENCYIDWSRKKKQRGDLPSIITRKYDTSYEMTWKLNGKIGRAGDLPAVVWIQFESDDGERISNYNNYHLVEVWYEAGKIYRSNDLPSHTTTYYQNNKPTNIKSKFWKEGSTIKRHGDKPSVIEENDKYIIERWRTFDNFKRGNDLPGIVYTYKKSGKQKKIWLEGGERAFRLKKDQPAIVDDENGIQIWTFKVTRGGIQPPDKTEYEHHYGSPLIGRAGDKPAILKDDGTMIWFDDGYIHRNNDKPAIVHKDGTMIWYKSGKIHRDGKPAVIFPSGREQWWTHGKQNPTSILSKKIKNEDVVNKIMNILPPDDWMPPNRPKYPE